MLHLAVLLESLLGLEQLAANVSLVGAVIVSAIMSERRLIRYLLLHFCPSSVDILASFAFILGQFFPGLCFDIHCL